MCNFQVYIEIGTPKHANDLRKLVQELAEFQNFPNGPKISAEQMARDIEQKKVYALIAYSKKSSCINGDQESDVVNAGAENTDNESSKELAGMTLYYYPGYCWSGECLHMEDIYVRPKFRRHGLGKKLVQKLADLARENGMVYINWDVLLKNSGAISFYQNSLNMVNMTKEKGVICWQLKEEAFEDVLKKAASKFEGSECSTFSMRMATCNDSSDVHCLTLELATVEGHPEDVKISEENIADYLSRGVISAILVYSHDKQLAGMLVYRPQYSTWLGQYIWIDDLIVTQSFRNKGLGLMLMAEIVKIAKSQEMSRIAWYMLNSNQRAIDFYNKLGAINMAEKDGWLNFRWYISQ